MSWKLAKLAGKKKRQERTVSGTASNRDAC
jgi:hypothetical protein